MTEPPPPIIPDPEKLYHDCYRFNIKIFISKFGKCLFPDKPKECEGCTFYERQKEMP